MGVLESDRYDQVTLKFVSRSISNSAGTDRPDDSARLASQQQIPTVVPNSTLNFGMSSNFRHRRDIENERATMVHIEQLHP